MVQKLAPGSFFGTVDRCWQTDLVKLSVVTHQSPRSVPVHSHEHLFFSLLLRGSYREFAGSQTFEYRPLTVVYHPEAFVHRDEIGEDGGQFFIVEVSPHMLGRTETRPPALQSIRDLSGGMAVWAMVRLYREVLAGHTLPVSLEEQVAELVDDVSGVAIDNVSHPPRWLAAICELIDARYREPLSLGELARHAGVHPVHLSRVFRQHSRQPIRAAIHQRRVQHACRLLADREMSLSMIAVETGFVDQSHLTNVFRRITGMTPGSMRVLLTGESSESHSE
jgi:AraC family transcriptional regulator